MDLDYSMSNSISSAVKHARLKFLTIDPNGHIPTLDGIGFCKPGRVCFAPFDDPYHPLMPAHALGFLQRPRC